MTTPLTLAVFSEAVEVVKLLWESPKIDVNQMPDIINGTALHCAARIGNQKIVFLLLLHNANTSLIDGKGLSSQESSKNKQIADLINAHAYKSTDKYSDFDLWIEEETSGTNSSSSSTKNEPEKSFLSSLDKMNPFVLISKNFHNNRVFLTQSIHQIYESYIEDFINYEPFKLRGYLKLIGTFKINSNTRYWVFNSLDGMLMTYKTASDYPRKYKSMYPLYSIESVELEQRTGDDKPWYSK